MKLFFSLGLHTQHFSRRDHLDLFLETKLNTLLLHFYYEIDYKLQNAIINQNEVVLKRISSSTWLKGKPHSQKYSNYTGYLSDSKGYLQHLFNGNYAYQDVSILYNNNIQCIFTKSEESISLYIF